MVEYYSRIYIYFLHLNVANPQKQFWVTDTAHDFYTTNSMNILKFIYLPFQEKLKVIFNFAMSNHALVFGNINSSFSLKFSYRRMFTVHGQKWLLLHQFLYLVVCIPSHHEAMLHRLQIGNMIRTRMHCFVSLLVNRKIPGDINFIPFYS